MNATQRIGIDMVLCFSLLVSTFAGAQEVGRIDYKMGRKAIVSITNSYGPITVKGSEARVVQVVYTSYAKSVTFDNQRHRNRISLVSNSDQSGDGWAEYKTVVPNHAFVNLFAQGPIHVEGLTGDITIQTANSPIEIKNLDGAHIHLKTLDGPITLAALHNGHAYIESVNGPINISDTSGSSVDATSTTGRITYKGDPGGDGEYRLSSQSGDVDVSIPASALIEIRTQSGNSQSGENPGEFATQTTRPNSLFLGPRTVSRPHFDLRSFTGKVWLKRPQR